MFEKEAEELEKEKCELLGIIQGKDKVIQELKKELNSTPVSKNQQLNKAKEIIQDLIDSLEVIDGDQIRELKVVKEAEQFLKESE